MVDEGSIAEAIVCGPHAPAHLAGIREFAEAGFDHVYVHQVGPDQNGFIDFYEREVLGEAERLDVLRRAAEDPLVIARGDVAGSGQRGTHGRRVAL